MDRLQFSELKKGMAVKDKDKNFGKIIKIENIHNITVKFTNDMGGYGFYCLDPACQDHYDPLYKSE